MSDRAKDASDVEEAVRLRRLSTLTETQAFKDLATELEAAEERYWRRHIADIKLGKPLDQRELDFMRGKFDAVRVILGRPAKAAKQLEAKEEGLNE